LVNLCRANNAVPNKACTGRLVGSAFFDLVLNDDCFPFRELVLPAAGNAGRWADAFENSVVGNLKMKSLSWLALFLIPYLASAGCTPIRPAMQPSVINVTKAATPTEMVSLLSDTPSPTITPFVTLEPAQVAETLQPLLNDPMNCAVPCFWGIIPGNTSFEEARIFFSKLGLIPFEKVYEGRGFYTFSYSTGSGHDFSVTLHINNNLVESIELTPLISEPKEGSPREWIAYSPETLIKRYGSPSRVRFTVMSSGVADFMGIGINMVMYFDTSNLIIHYSGYNMTPEWFCPLEAPFDFVRLWIGNNPPDTPSFETLSLEEATSLTMHQFTQLMLGDPKKACFSVKEKVNP
jgi:hypothetical protein